MDQRMIFITLEILATIGGLISLIQSGEALFVAVREVYRGQNGYSLAISFIALRLLLGAILIGTQGVVAAIQVGEPFGWLILAGDIPPVTPYGFFVIAGRNLTLYTGIIGLYLMRRELVKSHKENTDVNDSRSTSEPYAE